MIDLRTLPVSVLRTLRAELVKDYDPFEARDERGEWTSGGGGRIFQVLGSTDEHTTCELCGRTELRGTVALRDRSSGQVVHYGSDCAARASGWSQREVRDQVRSADRESSEAAERARAERAQAEFQSWQTFLRENTGKEDVAEGIAALGGFAAARQAYVARTIKVDSLDGMTTKVLLAARAILKYSPNQPRDQAGRWTSDGSFPANYETAADRGRTEARVGFRIGPTFNDSADTYKRDVQRSLGDALVSPPFGDGTRPSLQAIAHTASTITPPYRGMAVSAEDAARLQAFKVGDTIDLNLASWSSDRDSAAKFAAGQGGYTGRTGNNPVLMEMVGDKKALDVGSDTPLPGEKEWLSDGRFTVMSVDIQPAKQYPYADTWTGPRWVNPDTTIVRLAQESVFTSAADTASTKILKYSPDQPRDERGCWTSGGGAPGSSDIRERNAGAWRAYMLSVRPAKRDKLGNCYVAATRMMMDRTYLGLKNPVLIQATVTGQGSVAGRAFGHSWVEAEDPAGYGIRAAYDYSNGREIMLPAALYRQIGNARDVHEFTPEEATVQMLRFKHYGPWE